MLDAIAEFNRLGRDQFLKKYGFGHARSYLLVHDGQEYDSKAIVGAAHGYARPNWRPLKADQFYGGVPVKRLLERLGFRIIRQETKQGHDKMIKTIRRILELQPHYSSNNTPEMQERGRLIRNKLVAEIRALSRPPSDALGSFGSDFHVKASDGMGRKTELPWVRFCSKHMSPRPTEGFYCVLHFSTDGSAVHITLGCNSSQFQNGSFVQLPNSELDKRTAWARSVIEEAAGSLTPFIDPPDFGARLPLPKSFERATAMSKRIAIDDLDSVDIKHLLVRAAEFLNLVHGAESEGRTLSPADLDEIDIAQNIRPLFRQRGQGIGLSGDDRKRVERHAMALVEERLKDRGYVVNDTSADHPYDFEARKGKKILIVEVKGTTSDNPEAILMTRNEVAIHREKKGKTALFIVSSIRLVDQNGHRSCDWGQHRTVYRVGTLKSGI